MAKKPLLHKVIFHSAGKIYELYASQVISSEIWGFVRVSGIEFTPGEGLLIDPTEERLRDEFAGVKSLHLPMHAVVRIDEVEARGALRILDSVSGEKIMPFPLGLPQKLKPI